ncbi:hypothetical protein Val02_81810 [Virgisporangium aliadipatigenens]|uniref:PD-(D/E)XK endonuclease-like domain-containing protein n=1 Tax=Virgisporangium aliadipatigenens TaxID=741659 RepID=A0A8J4DUG8_9ACTN|nr:hypothetical protein [Virgisporangium aliadipatigenens]GIJ51295.1 hypothetical protein Val02_81810 [Virgisporangium aliadipatigenens]
MTASVSEAELAALIASLGAPTTPPPAAPAAPVDERCTDCVRRCLPGPCPALDEDVIEGQPVDERCGVTELRVRECYHCRPATDPAAEDDLDESLLGPWFPANYAGNCGKCGDRIGRGEQLRSDGEGSWLGECCGHPKRTPAGIVAAPAGPPPSTVKELRRILVEFETNRPRSKQVALGPSELGTSCQQQVARKLAGAPRKPIVDPTWAPFQGTAIHASMEDVIAWWNTKLGRERWLAEDRLYIDAGLPDAKPGVALGQPIEGNGDAFDLDHGMVVDWKFVGKTALEKLQRGLRMGKPPEQQVSAEYRVQAHLYGYGHAKKGRPVRYVRLVLLARSHDYDDSAEWTEEYRPEIALAAIDRYWATHDLLTALGVAEQPDMVAAVPATPSRDTCKWCPFHRPGKPSDWQGCPGDQPLERVVERATHGLIAQ